MGEACIRGDIQPGDGVYKSTDAGKTWTHIGFEDSDAISHIRIHPTNPNIVFVADFGKYGSQQRGARRLQVDGRREELAQGALQATRRPARSTSRSTRTNPNVMYAALWEAYRKEWQMSSGGPGSGMYKSTDGGETWTEITRNPGLPARDRRQDRHLRLARGPEPRLRARRERERRAVRLRRRRRDLDAREQRAPLPPARVLLHARLRRHEEQGPRLRREHRHLPLERRRQDVEEHRRGPRGDSHDLWIDPDDNHHVLLGRSGGDVTFNALADAPTWTAKAFRRRRSTTSSPPRTFRSSCAARSRTRATVCMSSASAPAAAAGRRRRLAGTSSPPVQPGRRRDGYIAPDPRDPDIFYSGTNANGGVPHEAERRTGEVTEVSPYPRMFSGEESAVLKERWQWTYPIVFSPVDGKTLYVDRSTSGRRRNGGHSWTSDQPRPHAPRSQDDGPVGRPDHARHERPGGVRGHLLDRAGQADDERDLGGLGRRADPRDQGRRHDVDERHAEGHAGVRPREPDRRRRAATPRRRTSR